MSISFGKVRMVISSSILLELNDVCFMNQELTSGSQIFHNQMTQFHTFSGLKECIFMFMQLAQNCTELKSNLRLYFYFLYSGSNWLSLKIWIVSHVNQSLVQRKWAFFKLIQLLITGSQVVVNEKSKKLVLVVMMNWYDIDDPICFLKQDNCLFRLVLVKISNSPVI